LRPCKRWRQLHHLSPSYLLSTSRMLSLAWLHFMASCLLAFESSKCEFFATFMRWQMSVISLHDAGVHHHRISQPEELQKWKLSWCSIS
jgi:hypothetical protein